MTNASVLPSSPADPAAHHGDGGHPPVTPERIMQFAFGYAPPLMIDSAVRYGVFDQLESGPKTPSEIAATSGASERGLRAIMNGLVGIGLLGKDGDGKFTLTPESAAFLVRSKPSYFGGMFQHMSVQLMPIWGQMREIVLTGRPGRSVNQEGTGGPFFEQFVEALFPMNYPAASTLAGALRLKELSSPYKALDLASGSGVWGIALAQASKQVQVAAVDWDTVIPVTRRMAERFGVGAQFSYISGDLMEAGFGQGFNLATLGHILHSEGEERSRSLLRKVYNAIAPGGTIAIAEFLCNDDRTGPPHPLIFSVNMLVNTDCGDTYTFPEIRGWLTDAGFVDARLLDAPGPSPLILGTKPG